MDFVIVGALALGFGVVWGKLLSPRFSWLAWGAGVVTTLGCIWVLGRLLPGLSLIIPIFVLLVVIVTPLAGAHYLAESEHFKPLPYRDRLRLWFLPPSRRGIPITHESH